MTGSGASGMTLIELMVALAIGSFLMIGALTVFNESRFSESGRSGSLAHAFGLEYGASDAWSFSGSLQSSELDAGATEGIERHTASVSARYRGDATRYQGRMCTGT